MSNLKVQQLDGPGGPPFELDLNILTIRAQGEAQFMDGFEEHFWALMHSEHDHVTVDLARSDGMADDAFRMIALNMFEIGNRGKAITIRIPESLERFFKHANLYRVADIEVVRLLGKKRSDERGADSSGNESADDASADAAKASRSESAVELPAAPEMAKTTPVRPTDTQMLKVELQQRYAEQMAAKQAAAAERESVAGADGGAVEPDVVRQGKGRLVDRRTGQIVDITKSPTHIGRVPGNDILIAMPLVSKRHAKITIEDNVYYIEDMGSSNGTYVNGTRLAVKSALADGARIQVAITSQYPNGAKEYTFRQDVE